MYRWFHMVPLSTLLHSKHLNSTNKSMREYGFGSHKYIQSDLSNMVPNISEMMW